MTALRSFWLIILTHVEKYPVNELVGVVFLVTMMNSLDDVTRPATHRIWACCPSLVVFITKLIR